VTAPEIARFLATGEHDDAAWPGSNFVERAVNAKKGLLEALLAEVRRRAKKTEPPLLPAADPLDAVRPRLRAMVEGLLPRAAHERALELLVGSVTFVLPSTIERVLRGEPFLGTAWKIANLYLGSLGLELLGEDAPNIVGLSEGRRSYVSPLYFECGRFEDFVLHECAHTLHDTKLRDVGLPAPRRREWLVELVFSKRETFAYSCEAYGCISALAGSVAERKALLEEHANSSLPDDERVDHAEYLDILREAVAARNGWKRILARCMPKRPRRAPRPATSDRGESPH